MRGPFLRSPIIVHVRKIAFFERRRDAFKWLGLNGSSSSILNKGIDNTDEGIMIKD